VQNHYHQLVITARLYGETTMIILEFIPSDESESGMLNYFPRAVMIERNLNSQTYSRLADRIQNCGSNQVLHCGSSVCWNPTDFYFLAFKFIQFTSVLNARIFHRLTCPQNCADHIKKFFWGDQISIFHIIIFVNPHLNIRDNYVHHSIECHKTKKEHDTTLCSAKINTTTINNQKHLHQ
jgi:hypothetical protein